MDKVKVKELFKTCKDELNRRRENTKYFNMKFFEKYLEYEKLIVAFEHQDVGLDVLHKYLNKNIFTDDFYNRNGPCYCCFLEIAYKYRNDFRRALGVAGV